jgi:DnaJ-class molecular chaperone|tara:strand:+ start:2345 stop:3283 length:939 start_codon:yes stop_codon:yes gene_type:complete
MSTGNFYDTLEVSSDSSDIEIKKSYRKLSLQYHPDRNSEPSAVDKIQKINEAFETLGDVDKKKEYDNKLKFGGDNNLGGGFPFPFPFPASRHSQSNDINDIFNHIFSHGGIHTNRSHGIPNIQVFHNGKPVFHTPQKPRTIERTIPITLENAYTGVQIMIEIERSNVQNGVNTIEKERIPMQIPKGILCGEKITIHGKGNVNETLKGDICITVQIAEHTYFKRQGNNLLYKTIIPLKNALCGFHIEVHHLSGKILRISNKTNINVVYPGYKQEILNLGMTKGDVTGMLIIEFDLQFPESLDETQRKTIYDVL